MEEILENLLNQLEKGEYIDENGHKLIYNKSYKEFKEVMKNRLNPCDK